MDRLRLSPRLVVLAAAGGYLGWRFWRGWRARQEMARLAAAVGRTRQRVVILGAGFGGLFTALHLSRRLQGDPTVDITLIDQHNYHLFTPMLTMVAGGLVEPRHVCFPVRSLLRRQRFRFRQAEVTGLDLENRLVHTTVGTIPFDYLVLALGSVVNFFGVPEAERYSLPFKEVGDAVSVRNRVIDALEQATAEPDPDRRRELLTFIICGGGPTGVELAAALHDFIHHSLIGLYPDLSFDEVRIVLVEAQARLVPTLDPRLAAAATAVLRRKRVEIRTETSVARVSPEGIETHTGERLRGRTVIWCAGIRAHPLVAGLPVPHGRGGTVVVDEFLELVEHPGVYAIGDCAQYTDPTTGRPLPPDAKVAIQQAEAVARILADRLAGREPVPFTYRYLGDMLSLGERDAVAKVGNLVLTGLPAWLLWRLYYLGRLLGTGTRLRVLGDWLLRTFAEPDIARLDLRPQPLPLGHI